MGFSVSGAAAVIFIGLLVSAATLYPAVDRYTERRSEAMDGKNERALAQQNTAVEPINATYNTTTGDLNGLRITVERDTAPDRIKLVSGPGVAVTTAVEVV